MSVRGDILDSVATELLTVTTGNGYNLDARDPVERNVPHSEDIPILKTKPTFSVDDTGVDQSILAGSGNTRLATMAFLIRAYVQSDDRNTPPTTLIGQVIADLKQLIDKPISLGGNVRYAEWDDIATALLEDQVGVVVMTVNVVYWYDADSP